MHAIPREQHSPLLAAALPSTESESISAAARSRHRDARSADDLRARSGRPRAAGRVAAALAAGAGAEGGRRGAVHLTADAVWRFFRRHAVADYRELTRKAPVAARRCAAVGGRGALA